MSPAEGFPEHMIDRILAFGFFLENQRPAEADFLEFIGGNVMPRDMIDPIFGPQQFLNHRIGIKPVPFSKQLTGLRALHVALTPNPNRLLRRAVNS